MKNLFLAIAFMLCGTFAFASTGEVETESIETVNNKGLVLENDSNINYDLSITIDRDLITCGVIIRVYNSRGSLIREDHYTVWNADTQAECEAAADWIVNNFY